MAMNLGLGLGLTRSASSGGGAPPLFGVYYYTPLTVPPMAAVPVSTLYSLDDPTAPGEDYITIEAVVEHSSTGVTRMVSVSGSAGSGWFRVSDAGAVTFSLYNTVPTQIFNCQTPNGLIADGAKARIRVTAKRISDLVGDCHCWVDLDGNGLVNQDGGTPATGVAFGSGLTWIAGRFAHDDTTRVYRIGQNSQTGGKVGSLAVKAGIEHNDASDHDLFAYDLYVRANAAEDGFEKWDGSAWAAL